MADLKMNLTKNFQLWEFVVSVTADRNGLTYPIKISAASI
jgi:hypothetical protein